MKLKGLDIFREKLPIFSGKRIILIPIFASVVFVLSSISIFFIYSLPPASNPLAPAFVLLVILAIETTALLLVYQMWYWKDYLKARYEQKSFQKILIVGLTGIFIMIALAFNNMTPIEEINPDLINHPYFSFWVESFTGLFDIDFLFLEIARYILCGFLFLLGIATIIRSLLTFGIDYMALVYLYFPEESRVQDYKIYSVIRHPTYTGVTLIAVSGFIYNLSLFNLVYLIIFLSLFFTHIFIVEERELIERFGDSYLKYRDDVPSIFAHPKKWKDYFSFLAGKDDRRV